MTYRRIVARGHLDGGYDHADNHPAGLPGVAQPYSFQRMVAGDLRRLEADQRDEWHLAEYARRTGLTTEQVRSVLDEFFRGEF